MDIEIVVRGYERQMRDPVYTCSTVQASNKTHVLEYLLVLCFVLMPPSFDYQI